MKWDEREAGAGDCADVCARVRACARGGDSPPPLRRLVVHAAWWCAVSKRPPLPSASGGGEGRRGRVKTKGGGGAAACVRVREGVRVRAIAWRVRDGLWQWRRRTLESAVAWGRAAGLGSRGAGTRAAACATRT
eukprot:7239280-Prymnesium_polylepis.1